MSEAFLIITEERKVIGFKGHGFFGWENLRKSIQIVLQFFPVSDGDVIILNDPSAGGLFPWALTAIHRVQSCYIIRSLPTLIPWALADKVDCEALRIPPTPLVQKGVLQKEIFQSLISHPLAGPYLQNSLLEIIRREPIEALLPFAFIKANSSQSNSSHFIQKLIQDLPSSEVRTEAQLSTGEILKLRLETSESGFTFDFSGTSAGQKCFLNETLLHGLCHEYISQFFNLTPEQNLELHSVMHFLTPRSSFLQSKFPQGQLHGLTRGSGAVLHAIQKCFQLVYARQPLPQHQFFSLWMQIQSTDSLDQWILPCGSGATEKEPGLSAFSFDDISKIPMLSQIQVHFEVDELGIAPLLFPTRVNPGAGLLLNLRAKKDLKILWMSEDPSKLLKGHTRYSQMQSNLLIYRREPLPHFGELKISAGESIQIQTGTGSGQL